MRNNSILVVGLVTYSEANLRRGRVSDVTKRDMWRIRDLRRKFGTVFSLAQQAPNHDPIYHVESTLTRGGARRVLSLLNQPQHANKKLNYICIELRSLA